MTLIWKDIKEYAGWYQISQFGDIKNIRTNKIRKPNLSGKYPSIQLSKNKEIVDFSIHVLVCEAFNGPKPTPLHEVNHKDGNKLNNFYSNLEWVTKKEQQQHRFKILKQKGPHTGKAHTLEAKQKIRIKAQNRNRDLGGRFEPQRTR